MTKEKVPLIRHQIQTQVTQINNLQQNYLKPPPPLYHTNQHQHFSTNHSIVYNTGSGKTSTLPSYTTTGSNSTSLSIALGSSSNTSKKLIIGGQKPFNFHESRIIPTKIKCEKPVKCFGDISSSSLGTIGRSEFSVPKVAGVKKLQQIPVTSIGIGSGGGNGITPIRERLFKRSASQTSSQYESIRASASRLSNVSSQFAGTSTCVTNNIWHAPGSFIFDYTSPGATRAEAFELIGCTQNFWFKDVIDENNALSRDQKLEIRQANLRRQAVQYSNSQKLRNNLTAKRRLLMLSKALTKLKAKDEP